MINAEERLINDLMLELGKYVDNKDLARIKNAVTAICYKYDFTEKKNELVVQDTTNEYLARLFYNTKALEGKTEKTIERYRFFIQKLMDFYPDKNFCEYTVNDLRNFMAMYKKRGNSDTTMDGIRRIYCSFFGWLDNEDYIGKSPAKKLNRIKHDTIKESPFTDGEMESMMLCAEKIRDKTILELLYSTGCRVSELCGIDVNDIDYQKKTVLLHGKGKKDRVVPLTEKVLFYISEYMKYRIENKINNPALFVSRGKHRITSSGVRSVVRRVSGKAKVENAHPHRFRVTRITVLLKRGMKLEEVQVIAGHADINTTVGYNRSDNSIIEYQFRRCG